MSLTYADPYLARHVTDEREARAALDVDALGTFPTLWRDRLIVLRVYLLVCIESTADPQDAFSAKLAHYRREFETTLGQARAEVAEAAGTTVVFASIPLERA
jgi:hypothetical protein